ncbi:hypothetical protein IPU75_05150 [Ochrobactrum sp. SD129]|nr:hypothetical protein [Ochrobactrum sp. SD129]
MNIKIPALEGLAVKMAEALSSQSLTANGIHKSMIDLRGIVDRQIEASLNWPR